MLGVMLGNNRIEGEGCGSLREGKWCKLGTLDLCRVAQMCR